MSAVSRSGWPERRQHRPALVRPEPQAIAVPKRVVPHRLCVTSVGLNGVKVGAPCLDGESHKQRWSGSRISVNNPRVIADQSGS